MTPTQPPPRGALAAACLAVGCSGAASLVYQVAWTRRLANVTSAMVTAQALALSIFIVGLGVGSWVAAPRSLRSSTPLRRYALLELGAALCALMSMPAFARSTGLARLATDAGLSPVAATWLQIAAIGTMLFVPAALMGATLPFVIADAERRGAGGPAVGLLYGVNTLGAALGSLAAGFVTIETLGLTRTVAAGALLATAAAAIALGLGRPPEGAAASRATHGADEGATTLMAAAALGGLVGVGAEVLWTRLVSLVVLTTVYALVQVLACVLLGIGLGGVLAAWIAKRFPEWLRLAAGLLALAGAVLIALVPVWLRLFAGSEALADALSRGASLGALLLVLAILGPPATLIAAVLPLLAATAERARSSAFGKLYAANAIGSGVGSLAAGFLLLPALGTAGTSVVLSLVAIGLGGLLLFGIVARVRALGAVAGALIVSAGLTVAVDVPRDLYAARLEEGTVIRALAEGATSDVYVTDDAEGRRRLWINSAWVAGTGGGHLLLGHVAALMVEQPKRAVGIALGTGQTFAAIMTHGVERLDCVDIDAGVIALSKVWFAEANGGLFEDARVHMHHDDGRAYLRRADQPYDLIVLEPLQAWWAGTSSLYSREFYREAERALAPGGVIAQWLPIYTQGLAESQAIVATALAVFPNATLWMDQRDGILLLHRGPAALDRQALVARVRERGLRQALAHAEVGGSADLLSMYLAGPEALARWSAGGKLIVDDRPFLEFAAARDLHRDHASQTLRSLAANLSPTGSEVADFVRAAALAEALGSAPPDDLDRMLALDAQAPSARLRRHLVNAVLRRVAADPSRELAIYEEVLGTAPALGPIAVNLAVGYLERGRRDDARRVLVDAERRGGLMPRGRQLLETLR